MPGGKPKESAGRPVGADAGENSPKPAGGDAGGMTGAMAGGSNQAAEIRTTNSELGAPQVGTTTLRGGIFRAHKQDAAPSVQTTVYVMESGARPVGYTSKMSIDADGAGGAWRKDRTGQPKTSLLYKNGDSLNPETIPFIVVPKDFHRSHPGVGLGDYSMVTRQGRTVYAIVGDHGPDGVIGEGSISLAASLGIDPNPNTGGTTRKEVDYLIVPGSREKDEPLSDAAKIQARGKAVFEAAGVRLR